MSGRLRSEMRISKLSLVLIFAIATEIIIAIWYYSEFGSDKIVFHIVKIFFLGVFAIMTYHQIKWAKWILVGWFIFNSTIAFSKVRTIDLGEDFVLIGMSIMYLLISGLILFLSGEERSTEK